MKHAFWYFDFISPFAYLQNRRLHEFLDFLKIERKPLLFAGLLKHWGTKGSVELDIKIEKRPFRCAQRRSASTRSLYRCAAFTRTSRNDPQGRPRVRSPLWRT